MDRKLTERQIKALFMKELDLDPHAADIAALAAIETSDQESESYRWGDAAPPMNEWLGEIRESRPLTREIVIDNKEYVSAVGARVRDLRNNKTGARNRKMQELAERVNVHKWIQLSNLLKFGDTATKGLAYDSANFFSTTHNLGNGNQSNLFVKADLPALGVVAPTAPTAIEMSLAILAVAMEMYKITDIYGEPVNENARTFVVVVPPGLAGATLQAILSDRLDGGRTNPLPVGKGGFSFRMINDPRSDWTTEFAVIRSDGIFRSMILQEETPGKVDILDENSEHAFKSNEIIMKGTWNGGADYGRFEYAAKGTLSV